MKYVHIKVEENAMHRQGYPEAPFAHGETQVLPRSAFATALRDLFLSFSTSPSSPGEAEPGPVVLLLHDADTTHAMLQCAGVDLGACVPGIRDLLVRGPLAPPAPPNPNPDLYLDYGVCFNSFYIKYSKIITNRCTLEPGGWEGHEEMERQGQSSLSFSYSQTRTLPYSHY